MEHRAPKLPAGLEYMKIEGVLAKKSRDRLAAAKNSGWRRRHFVLQEHMLYYYSGDVATPETFRGQLPLQALTVTAVLDDKEQSKVRPPRDTAPLLFKLDDGKGKPLYLVAPSETNKKRWCEALQRNIYLVNNPRGGRLAMYGDTAKGAWQKAAAAVSRSSGGSSLSESSGGSRFADVAAAALAAAGRESSRGRSLSTSPRGALENGSSSGSGIGGDTGGGSGSGGGSGKKGGLLSGKLGGSGKDKAAAAPAAALYTPLEEPSEASSLYRPSAHDGEGDSSAGGSGRNGSDASAPSAEAAAAAVARAEAEAAEAARREAEEAAAAEVAASVEREAEAMLATMNVRRRRC